MIFTNPKKAYFKKLLEGVNKMIWDLEFKGFKTKEIRENVRVTYDDCKMKVNLLTTQIEKEETEPTLSSDELGRLKDQKTIYERDMARYLEQMKAMDVDVNGLVPSAESPDGFAGISQQLDSLQELKVMVKDYIKTI